MSFTLNCCELLCVTFSPLACKLFGPFYITTACISVPLSLEERCPHIGERLRGKGSHCLSPLLSKLLLVHGVGPCLRLRGDHLAPIDAAHRHHGGWLLHRLLLLLLLRLPLLLRLEQWLPRRPVLLVVLWLLPLLPRLWLLEQWVPLS